MKTTLGEVLDAWGAVRKLIRIDDQGKLSVRYSLRIAKLFKALQPHVTLYNEQFNKIVVKAGGTIDMNLGNVSVPNEGVAQYRAEINTLRAEPIDIAMEQLDLSALRDFQGLSGEDCLSLTPFVKFPDEEKL